jgi:hypothetical protein
MKGDPRELKQRAANKHARFASLTLRNYRQVNPGRKMYTTMVQGHLITGEAHQSSVFKNKQVRCRYPFCTLFGRKQSLSRCQAEDKKGDNKQKGQNSKQKSHLYGFQDLAFAMQRIVHCMPLLNYPHVGILHPLLRTLYTRCSSVSSNNNFPCKSPPQLRKPNVQSARLSQMYLEHRLAFKAQMLWHP